MSDNQRKISDLESAATDCDLISQLTPSRRVRASNENLSAQYKNAANDLKHPEVIASERRIEQARRLITLQRGIVARLENARRPTEQARELLRTLEQTLAIFERQRERYLRARR